ncbi:MAG TPA: MFS transporter [Kineosporiaceae bacterium]|nr:MFS transporter [Kineosporiaceae bacterium]
MSIPELEQSTTQSDLSVTSIRPRRSPDQTSRRPARYRDVFAVAEFRAVFLADLTSLLGDQIAAVAVAVLLYERSGSPLLAALGYATAYLPWLLGGPLLAAWAERFPPRTVLIGCDLGRAALIGLAALPGLPLLVIGLLVFTAALLAPPFESTRSAVLPQILEGDRYPVAMSLRDAIHQSAQLVGFGVGGALVLVLSAPGALALDAVTFAVSALILRSGLPSAASPRPRDSVIDLNRRPDDPAGSDGRSLWREALAGFAVIRADRMLSTPLLLGIIGAAYAIVPEAIAPAYADSVGGDATAVGLIMAAVAGGSVLGGLAMGRMVAPARRIRLIRPLALAGTLPLLLVLLRPGLTVSLALFALTGLASSYQVAANAMFAQRLPVAVRARAFGIAITGLYGGQALAIVLAGAAAQFLGPATVVAGAGLLGAIGILLLPHPGQHAGPTRSGRRQKRH